MSEQSLVNSLRVRSAAGRHCAWLGTTRRPAASRPLRLAWEDETFEDSVAFPVTKKSRALPIYVDLCARAGGALLNRGRVLL